MNFRSRGSGTKEIFVLRTTGPTIWSFRGSAEPRKFSFPGQRSRGQLSFPALRNRGRFRARVRGVTEEIFFPGATELGANFVLASAEPTILSFHGSARPYILCSEPAGSRSGEKVSSAEFFPGSAGSWSGKKFPSAPPRKFFPESPSKTF